MFPFGVRKLPKVAFAGSVGIQVGGIDEVATSVQKRVKDLAANFFGCAIPPTHHRRSWSPNTVQKHVSHCGQKVCTASVPRFSTQSRFLSAVGTGSNGLFTPSIVPLVAERLAYPSYSDFPPFASLWVFFAHFALTTYVKHTHRSTLQLIYQEVQGQRSEGCQALCAGIVSQERCSCG